MSQLSPSGSIATSGRSLAGSASTAATGRAKCRPAAPRSASGCQGSLLPVVSTAAASAAAATRTQAPMLPIVRGSSSSTTGAARSSASDRLDVDRRAAGDRDHPGAGRVRGHLGQHLGLDRRDPLRQRAGQVRGQLRRQAIELLAVGGDRLDQLGAEAQRVLERVKPLQHGQLTIAAGGSVTLHEGVAHRLHHSLGSARESGDHFLVGDLGEVRYHCPTP